MKALILAAGRGTRLRPITDTIPKCLVDLADKPLLEYHLDRLDKYGVRDVCVNTHYLPEQVRKFFGKYTEKNSKMKIRESYERELLGSAGALRNNWDFFKGEENFYVIYGDNLTNINYKQLLDFHLLKGGICSIACYIEPNPGSKGVVVFDKEKRLSRFVEKPAKDQNVGNYANAGIYVLNKRIFNYLRENNGLPYDFGRDLFPKLLQNNEPMYAYLMSEFLLDIGSLETYRLAQSLIGKINFN